MSRLKELSEKRKVLLGKIDNANSEEELNEISSDIRALDMKIEEEKNSTVFARTAAVNGGEKVERRIFNPNAVAARSQINTNQSVSDEEDVFSSLEYRKAFKEYVLRGTAIPQQYNQAIAEKRADQMTVVSDVGALIPTNLMNKIIEEAQSYGMILPRVTQTQYQGGVEIPIADIFPTASWITEETVSDEQKAEVNAKVTFSYYMLECKVGLTLLSATVSLSVFENTIVNNIKIAMVKAIETAIVKGSGSGQPKGFLKETLAADKIVTLKPSEVSTIPAWAEVEAAMPLAYENGSYYIMNKSTWEKYINGAVDSIGQKIGFASMTTKLTRYLNGREVLLTEYLPGFDVAATGDVFCALINLRQYMLNSNMAMTYKKYMDEDKNKVIHKALMIADGKIADKNGIVFIKKGANA